MAATDRWSLSDTKKFLIAALILGGVFIVCFGTGLSNVAVGGLGVAIAILGPGFILFSNMRGNTRENLYGTAHVHEVSALPVAGTVGRCEMELLVTARGLNGVPVRVRDVAVPVNKWPDVGATLPIVVAAGDARKVRVLWDEVRTHGEVAFDDQVYTGYTEDLSEGEREPVDSPAYDHGAYPPDSAGEDDGYSPGDPTRPGGSSPDGSAHADHASAHPDHGGTYADDGGTLNTAGTLNTPGTLNTADNLTMAGNLTAAGSRSASAVRSTPGGSKIDGSTIDGSTVTTYLTTVAPTAASGTTVPPLPPREAQDARMEREPLGRPPTSPRPRTPPVGPVDRPVSPAVPATAPVGQPVATTDAPSGPATTSKIRRRPSPTPRRSRTADPATRSADQPAAGPTDDPVDATPDAGPVRDGPVTGTGTGAVRPMTASAPRDDDASPMSSGAGHAAGPVVAGAASASDPHLTANPTTQPTHPKPRFIELEFITPPASTSQPRPASTSSAAWVVPGQAPPGSPVAWATGAQPAPPTEWPARESQPPTEPYDPYPVTEPYDPYPTARSHDPYRAAETTPAPVDRPARVVRPEHQHRQPEPFDPYPTAAAPVTPVPAPTPAVDPADELEPEPFIDGAIARFLAAGPRRSSQPLSDVNGVSVTLTVADLGRSLRFYRDTLGLVELDSGPGSAVLATGDARVVLRRDVDMPPVDRRVVHLNLEVPDVYEAYERLRDQGVEFVHRPRTVAQGEQLELCSATFRDPDGHAIALTRWEIRRQA